MFCWRQWYISLSWESDKSTISTFEIVQLTFSQNWRLNELPVFQVKHWDSSQGVHEPTCQWGQTSSPHFCIPDGAFNPASSHKPPSTDLVMLFKRTMHWAARTWKPLPPHVCEHFDHGVTSHSNFKCSFLPSQTQTKYSIINLRIYKALTIGILQQFFKTVQSWG